MSGLTDVNVSAATNGQVLTYSASTNKWYPSTILGSITGASNIGTGFGIFNQVNGYNLEFKSLIAGSGISISSGSTSITISNDYTQSFLFMGA